MAGRLSLSLLGATALSLSGCYSERTADEEYEDITPEAPVIADDVVVSDAGTGMEPATPGGGESDAAVAQPDSAVTLPSDAGLFGNIDCRNPTDLIAQVICRAQQGGAPTTPGTGGTNQNPQAPRDGGVPNIQDIIDGFLGGRDAGRPTIPGTGSIPGVNCRNPTDLITIILCGAGGTGGLGGLGGTGGTGTNPRNPQTGGIGQFADLLEALQEIDCERRPEGIAGLICLLGTAARGDGGAPGFTFPGFPGGPRGSANDAGAPQPAL